MLDLVLQFSEQLDCGVCDGALVWVQNPLKLAVNVGVIDPDNLKYLVQMHIKDVTCANSTSWYYTLEYDEAILADLEDPLLECDIKKVCCEGCFIEWLKENPTQICVEDTSSVDLTINPDSGCLFADVLLSEDDGNIIELRDDGLFAEGGGAGGNDWHILGNSDIVDGTNFLGTTNDVAVDFRQNNERVFRFQAGTGSKKQSIVGGPDTNSINGADNSFIGGGTANIIGGTATNPSHLSSYSVVTGGIDNVATNAIGCGIFSGERNEISGDATNDNYPSDHCVIGGGYTNTITDSSTNCGIFSGRFNIITLDFDSVICGGSFNAINTVGSENFIGGGDNNLITATDATDNHAGNTICGGESGLIDNTNDASILGGKLGKVTGAWLSSVCGGYNNCITGTAHTDSKVIKEVNAILCGESNLIASGIGSSILGGGGLKIGSYTLAYQNSHVLSRNGTTKVISPTTQVDISAFADFCFLGDVDLWLGNIDGVARKLKLFEPNGDTGYSTANFSSFRAQAQAANIDYIWPAAAGVAGNSLKIQSVVGTTVTLEWA